MLRIGRARALIGAAISLVALWLVLRSVDLAATRRAPPDRRLALDRRRRRLPLRRPRWPGRSAGSASSPRSRPCRTSTRSQYLLVGYVANNVLPARLGELVRSHYAGDREGISRSTTLGTIVVERVIDLVVVVVDRVRRDPRPVRPGRRRERRPRRGRGGRAAWPPSSRSASPPTACPAPSGSPPPRTATRRSRSWPANLRDGLRGRRPAADAGRGAAAERVLVGLRDPRRSRRRARRSAYELTIGQAALLASGVALASAIPAGPANLGTFELAAVQIGKAVGIPDDDAFAIALIVHVTIVAGHLGRRHHLGRPARLAATGRQPRAEPGPAAGAVSPRLPAGRLEDRVRTPARG